MSIKLTGSNDDYLASWRAPAHLHPHHHHHRRRRHHRPHHCCHHHHHHHHHHRRRLHHPRLEIRVDLINFQYKKRWVIPEYALL